MVRVDHERISAKVPGMAACTGTSLSGVMAEGVTFAGAHCVAEVGTVNTTGTDYLEGNFHGPRHEEA